MRNLFLIFLFFLTGCGFSPLYQEMPEGNVPVEVSPIPDQYGYTMRQIIQNKLGHSTDTQYVLNVSAPVFSAWDQSIDDKNFATMMAISGTVSYTLTQKKTHKNILNTSTSLSGSYAVVKDPYATTIAERKVKKDLAEQLAEQVSLHVLGTLAGVRN